MRREPGPETRREQSEEERARLTRLLGVVLWFTVGLGTVVQLVPILTLPGYRWRGIVIALALPPLGAALTAVSRRAGPRQASVLFIASMLVLISCLAPSAGGTRAPAAMFYITIVLTAGLLLGERAGIVAAAVAILVTLGFVAADGAGLVPPPSIQHTSLTYWLVLSVCIGLVLAVQRLSTRTIKEALDRATTELAERRRAEDLLQTVTRGLEERVKELRLMHAVGRLLQRKRPPDRELLTELVAMLPQGWQHPDVCKARIVHGDLEVTTSGWRDSPWKLSQPLAGGGVVEVVYLTEKPAEAEGPFLREERTLIEAITEMLDAHIEHRRAADELEQKEAELRSVFEHAAVGLALMNAQGRIVACNPALERFLGYREEELAALTFEDVTHPEDADVGADQLAALQSGERDSFRSEKRYRRKDGSTAWGRLTASRIRDGSGPAFGIVVVEDISIQARADEEKRHLEARLRQAQKMQALGTLAGGIAHDFNNILTAIAGNAHLAAEELAGHPAEESVSEIKTASTRAVDLVRRILVFSRQQETPHTVFAIQPVIEEALKLLRATLPAMIQIMSRFAPDLPAISGDATQIHQVIMNLGTNAAHAMSDGGGILGVDVDTIVVDAALAKTSPDLREGEYVRIVVTDRGCGMTAEVIERIFEPFFTTKAPGTGTGLGLSVVHGILKSHGGAVTVYSEVGKGTTFRLYLPPARNEVASAPGEEDAVVRGSGERVLYIDDEQLLVNMMKRRLERLGYAVSGHANPHEALEAFRSAPNDFDVVISDISMPGLTGIEVARSVRAIRKDIPIVLTSGYMRKDDAEAAQAIGVQELLPKPTGLGELGRALRRALAGPRPS